MRPKQPNADLAYWILRWFSSNNILIQWIGDNVFIDSGDEAPQKRSRAIVVGYEWLIAMAEEDDKLKEILVRWMI